MEILLNVIITIMFIGCTLLVVLFLIFILNPFHIRTTLMLAYNLKKANKKASERENVQNEVLASNKQLTDTHQYFPVRYCSEKISKNAWRRCAWEASGILFFNKDNITFIGKYLSNNDIRIEFSMPNAKIEWIGMQTANLGMLAWFTIYQPDKEKCYFTSETGASVPKGWESGKSTKIIYEKLMNIFGSNFH